MNGTVVVLVLLLLSVTILAFYWYFRHRRLDRYLRQFEGERYDRARDRLSGLADRDRQPPADDEPFD